MKRGVHDLAVLGGPPAFLGNVLVGRPNIGDRHRFFDRLDWALSNGWLSNGGPLVSEFESRVAALAGVRHCVATCNGTLGLQVLLKAMDLSGEVIVPSLTFAATPHAVSWIGLTPVFADVDPVTGCLDPVAVQAMAGPDTAAILGVHLWGNTCPVTELEKVAEALAVPLVFDAAHALGATRNGRPVGGFGAAEVFSFHATKIVNAFEGGAIVTDDDDLAATARGLTNFGFESPGIAGAVGTNAKMSEAAAAMGLTSLDTLADCVRHNEEIYDLYLAEIGHLDGISLVPFNRADVSNFQYLVIRIDEAVAGLARDTLMAVLRAENIMAQRYFWPPCHRMPAYAEPPDSPSARALPVTERLSEQVIALPTGPAVGREDVRRICDVVRLAVTHPRLVNERRPQIPTPGGVHR